MVGQRHWPSAVLVASCSLATPVGCDKGAANGGQPVESREGAVMRPPDRASPPRSAQQQQPSAIMDAGRDSSRDSDPRPPARATDLGGGGVPGPPASARDREGDAGPAVLRDADAPGSPPADPDDNRGDPQADAGPPVFVVELPTDGWVPLSGCAAGFERDQARRRPATAASSAPNRCEGFDGHWRCQCEGTSRVNFAAGCTGALRLACGVQAEPFSGNAEPPPSVCGTSFHEGRAGNCEPSRNGGFQCLCDGEEAMARSESSCEHALWAACAQPCDGDHGGCEPIADGDPGHFRCSCTSNGLRHPASSSTCEGALRVACDPNHEGPQGCNGYGGRCERVDRETLRCTCADGTEHTEAYPAGERHRPCRATLERVCGPGARQGDTLCTQTGNGYSARCERAPDGTGPFACDCVFRGMWGDRARHDGGLQAASCDTALRLACPELEPVTPADRQRACAHLAGCDRVGWYTGLTRQACLESIDDGCTACMAAELSRIWFEPGDCRGDGNLNCYEQCDHVVPTDTAIDNCKQRAGDPWGLSDRDDCLCERCQPTFSACARDYDCRDLLTCFQMQDCSGTDCQTDPFCGPMLKAKRASRSPSLAHAMHSCPALSECWSQSPEP